MRILLLLLSMVSFLACGSCKSSGGRQNAEDKEPVANEATQDAPANGDSTLIAANAVKSGKSDTVLKKVVGALSKEDPQAQHYECEVKAADLSNLEQVQQWIKEVAEAPLIDAMYFRATIPSVQIFAYQNGQEVLLFESYSAARYRSPSKDGALKNDTAEELIKIAHQKCPYP